MNNIFLNENNKTQPVQDIIGNVIEYIDPNSVNKSKIGINLFGENYLTYAKQLNENFIKIIQKFYGENAPSNPLIGQEWFSKNDNKLYRFDGYTWKQIDEDRIFGITMLIKENKNNEILINETIFELDFDNLLIYDQDMNEIIYTFDPNNKEKVYIKTPNVKMVYIFIFHPNDKVSNPKYNKKIEMLAEMNSQTQYDISDIMKGNKISNISVKINDDLIPFDDFYVENNILNLNGKLFNIKKNDIIKVWKYGGSLKKYVTEIKLKIDNEINEIKIPKFFEKIKSVKIVDLLNKSLIVPLSVEEKINYYEIKLLTDKKVEVEIEIEVI